jgi:hypothetical protein
VGVIAYVGGSNAKTVGMIETYILVHAQEPHAAAVAGLDESVCGGCSQRLLLARKAKAKAKAKGDKDPKTICYVMQARGPRRAWEAWIAGRAQPMDLSVLARLQPVRMGTYGDPCAVPFTVWEPLLTTPNSRWTGYTHQWRSPFVDARWQQLVMASVDNPTQRRKAKAAGWRTFRVRRWRDGEPEPILKSETSCPASREAGKVTTCMMCNRCGGQSTQGPDVVIIDHGFSTRSVWKAHEAKTAP